MRTPKFLDRMRNKGFEDVSDPDAENELHACRAGNIELMRLFIRKLINPGTGRPDEQTASRGLGRIAFFKEDGGRDPSRLIVNEDKADNVEGAGLGYYEIVARDGAIPVVLNVRRRGQLKTFAQEVCSICLNNRDNRCGKPQAPYEPMGSRENIEIQSAQQVFASRR